MKSASLILSLTTALVAGLGLAACDRTMDNFGDDQDITGRSCEAIGETHSCGDDGSLAYCGYIDGANALEYGPCVPPEDQECMVGEWKHVDDPNPPTDEDGWEDPCSGTDYSCEVVGGVPMWQVVECETPLVLRFDDAPVEMIAAEATPAATFDISMREGSCITTDWPTAATPWLVVDLDHSGTIDGGHELFGSGTRLRSGAPAQHGFAALDEFDHNRDGVVDADDPRFGELMLWRDVDSDRRATPAELEPLTEAGVERIALDFTIAPECDERGNCGVQRAGFEHAGGVGEVVDLYLACH